MIKNTCGVKSKKQNLNKTNLFYDDCHDKNVLRLMIYAYFFDSSLIWIRPD